MSKFSIALDCDGVIANHYAEMEIRITEKFGEEAGKRSQSLMRFEEDATIPKEWIKEQFDDPTFWMNSQPFPDAWYMMNKWFGAGWDVYIVTVRHTVAAEYTEKWLDEWDIMYSNIYKNVPKLEKYKTLNELNADIFVDDNPGEVAAASDHVASFLRAQPYNRNMDIGTGTVVKDLYQLDAMLQTLV